ncbi:ABC transporter ATP-binding protein [Candidatus Bipolaricaulota bacterium]|nr:ABC transporter ATP-binding protein [Candidatus Bipolaricaulota bacterium]
MYALSCESLTKSFRKGKGKRVQALCGVGFAVRAGEIYGILGPNGSGKSTLVRILATLLLPDAGRAQVLGYDVVRQARRVREVIHRVSTEAAFFKKLSPLENLLYGARLYGVPGRKVIRRARGLLAELGIPEDKQVRPMEQLSRGQQQKVAVARALLIPPPVLLLDEPTTGLDPRSKREVQELIRGLRDEEGTTVLLTTHDMEEADRLCDRVAILDEGRLVAEGSPRELKEQIRTDGQPVSMEDVFFALTGKEWDDEG